MCSFESVHMNVSLDVCDIYCINVAVNKITVMNFIMEEVTQYFKKIILTDFWKFCLSVLKSLTLKSLVSLSLTTF